MLLFQPPLLPLSLFLLFPSPSPSPPFSLFSLLLPIPLLQISDFSHDHCFLFFFKIFLFDQEPVILTNTHVTKSTSRWTMDFLSEQFGSVPITVLEADDYRFKYYNDKRNKAKYLKRESRSERGEYVGRGG